MIQTQTMLKVADNSGAKILQCIRVLGGTRRRYAQIGDIIVGAVKEAEPRRPVKKHDVVRAVIIRQKKAFRRADGSYIRFDDNAVVILDGDGSYTYEVVGTGEGTYGLSVTSIISQETTTFTATDISTSANATHRYAVDWEALSQSGDGVTVQIDSDGDGDFEQSISSSSEFTQADIISAGDGEEGLPIWIWIAVGVGIIFVAGIVLGRRLGRRGT